MMTGKGCISPVGTLPVAVPPIVPEPLLPVPDPVPVVVPVVPVFPWLLLPLIGGGDASAAQPAPSEATAKSAAATVMSRLNQDSLEIIVASVVIGWRLLYYICSTKEINKWRKVRS
jgi:hypothetical protein